MALFQCNFISYTLVREVQINVILPTVTCPESMGMGGEKPFGAEKAGGDGMPREPGQQRPMPGAAA